MTSLQLRLTELMNYKNKTVADLEKATGLNKNTIHSILAGTSKNPGANTLNAISKALDISLESILSDDQMNIEALNEEQMQIFNKVTDATINIIISKSLRFNIDKLNSLIREVYQYTITIDPPHIDDRFIHWIIDKYHRV